MSLFMLMLDLSPEPANPLSWGPLLLLLAVVFVLSVAIAGGLVFVLIRFKRRKQSN